MRVCVVDRRHSQFIRSVREREAMFTADCDRYKFDRSVPPIATYVDEIRDVGWYDNYSFMVIKCTMGAQASTYHITMDTSPAGALFWVDYDHSQSRTRFPSVFTADYNRYNHKSAPTELRLEFADCYRCVSNLQ